MDPIDSEICHLLDRAASGDADARDRLLMRYGRRLKRMVHVRLDDRLRSRIDASDVVQDALLEASRRLPEYLQSRPIPFYPWLRQIAWQRLARACERHLYAQKRSVSHEHPWDPSLSDESVVELAGLIATPESSPSARAMRRELQEQVREALDELPHRDREILVMRYLERMKFGEIAATLQLTEAGTKSRHRRALIRLGSVLNGDLS